MSNFNRVILILIFLALFDVFIWSEIFFGQPSKDTRIYALDVGQGDSELVVLPGGPKILIDGGPDNKVLGDLSKVLRPTDRYLDLVILSHPQMDHYMGLIDVLKRFKVGTFIYNGEVASLDSFKDLIKVVQENKIQNIALREGDGIKYEDNVFDILSPPADIAQAKDPNADALVLKFTNPKVKALFTADIDSKIEKNLFQKYDLDIDVLKVAHHGSKFSSSEEFLKAATPKISLIGVGANNSYGHPTPEALGRLTAAGSKIFRTDKNGNIEVVVGDSGISIRDEK